MCRTAAAFGLKAAGCFRSVCTLEPLRVMGLYSLLHEVSQFLALLLIISVHFSVVLVMHLITNVIVLYSNWPLSAGPEKLEHFTAISGFKGSVRRLDALQFQITLKHCDLGNIYPRDCLRLPTSATQHHCLFPVKTHTYTSAFVLRIRKRFLF